MFRNLQNFFIFTLSIASYSAASPVPSNISQGRNDKSKGSGTQDDKPDLIDGLEDDWNQGNGAWESNYDKDTGLYYLSYSFMSTDSPDDLTFEVFRKGVMQAMCSWEQSSNVRFRDVGVSEWSANILVGFERGEHSDGHAFDGPGGEIAHAFAPVDGRIHFDADEKWNLAIKSEGSEKDVFSTALHELGHTLGLSHSNMDGAVMAPKYKFRGSFDTFQMPDNEIFQIEQKYGHRPVGSTASMQDFSACQDLKHIREPICDDELVFFSLCKRWAAEELCQFPTVRVKCRKTCRSCPSS